MTMRAGILVLVGLLSWQNVFAQDAGKPPNVLFIAVDDLRTELGCYGRPYVDSPHLDRLASQSTLFTRHYVQVATCGASRYALLTGRSPLRSGALGNDAAYRGSTAFVPNELPAAQTMPELFRRNGYQTILIGKISHTPDGRVFAYNGSGDGRDELPGAWSEKLTPFGPWKRGWGTFFAYSGGRSREDGGGHKDLMEFAVEDDNDLPDGLMAEAAIRRLRALSTEGQPFFMGLGFFKPHLPFVAPRQDWEAIQAREIPGPEHPEKTDSPHWHKSGEFYKYASAMKKTWPLSPADTRTARQAYLACVRYVDRQIGRVLSALDEAGLSQNTIVVVWGDHGWHLGDTAIWGKHTPFERANHSTLMISAPGVSRAGQKCSAVVETLDLYPTLVDLCRLSFRETVHPLDGVSLRPLLDGSAESVKPVAISYWGKNISVRDATHRLVVPRGSRAKDAGLELYDHSVSPDPVTNIAAEHPEIVARLMRHIPSVDEK
ncbi:MAG: sulfatase [Planctomycetaceae bacterium]|nr:sulfatase [Planctomycetaceae bacterium]